MIAFDSLEVLSLGYWGNLGTVKLRGRTGISSKTTGFHLDGNKCPAGHGNYLSRSRIFKITVINM